MIDNKSIEIKSNNKTIAEFNGKEYICDYKELLTSVKNAQKIIMDNETSEIPVLIKLAKRNLTKNTITKTKNMIINLQKKFNDDGILEFIENTISLVTAIETSNLLYGDLIDISEVRKYLSNKTTEIVVIRVNKLLNQLKKTNYEEKNKLTFIVEHLNQCNKVFEYCWDIYPNNIQTLKYTISILNTLIKQRVKLGLDDYNVELLRAVIENNQSKIDGVLSNNNSDIDKNTFIKSSLDQSIFVAEEVLTTDLVVSSNTRVNLKSDVQIATERFIDISNDVVEELDCGEGNNFINIAFQKYNSIIATIETLNFFGGTVIDKEIVSKNISMLLTDIIYTNFNAINLSWDKIEDKADEDYLTYYKEIYNYKKLLYEAYEINKDNIDALKKAIEIEIIIYNNYKAFHLTPNQAELLKRKIDYYVPTIKKEFVDFKGLVLNTNGTKKKKGFWSKFFK